MMTRRRWFDYCLGLGVGLGWSVQAARRSFLLSATVDFPDDVRYGPYSPRLLAELMRSLQQAGVGRIYWLYYGDLDPESEWAGGLYRHMEFGPDSLAALGEPLAAAVPAARAQGMEIFGVLKPFNTGISGTHPEGAPGSPGSRLARLGGRLIHAKPFIERHPELRVRRRSWRKPAELQQQSIRRIRLLKKDDTPTRIRRENISIWTSENNFRYQPRDLQLKLSESVEAAPREVRDYFGRILTAAGAPVRVLTLEGFALTDPYVCLTTDFRDQFGDFQNTALAMIEVYGDGPQPLPIVVATRGAVWEGPRSFQEGGLEFDSGYGPFQVGLDVDRGAAHEGEDWWHTPRSGCIAFARGKNDYLPCTPCEAYPQVRRLWRGWVERILAAGVDGLDLRVSAHGSLTDEPWEYGFNAPVLEEYARLYGATPEADMDLGRLARIRGRHYSDFVQETAERVRRAGRRMQVHLHAEAFRPHPTPGELMGFPANLEFEWRTWLERGWVDGVLLRTSQFEALEVLQELPPGERRLDRSLADPVVREMLELSGELGLPVTLNRYVSRALSAQEYLADLESIIKDHRFSGFDLYETAHLLRAVPSGDRLQEVEDRLRQIAEKWGQARNLR